MKALRKIFIGFNFSAGIALALAGGATLLPLRASAAVLSPKINPSHQSQISPAFWAGTDCYDLISAQGDWAQFCISVNVSDWTEAKQALVTFKSLSGSNFRFLRVDGLDLNRNEVIVQSKDYMSQSLDSTGGYFATNWSYTWYADYVAAVNMPCVEWQNGHWACASPTWYYSSSEFIL